MANACPFYLFGALSDTVKTLGKGTTKGRRACYCKGQALPFSHSAHCKANELLLSETPSTGSLAGFLSELRCSFDTEAEMHFNLRRFCSSDAIIS